MKGNQTIKKMGFFLDLLKWTLLWVLAVLLMFVAVAVFAFNNPITTGIAVVIGLSGVAAIVYAILKPPSIDRHFVSAK